ncbi:hypothetical protein D3C77_99820 [compost metagenome]
MRQGQLQVAVGDNATADAVVQAFAVDAEVSDTGDFTGAVVQVGNLERHSPGRIEQAGLAVIQLATVYTQLSGGNDVATAVVDVGDIEVQILLAGDQTIELVVQAGGAQLQRPHSAKQSTLVEQLPSHGHVQGSVTGNAPPVVVETGGIKAQRFAG